VRITAIVSGNIVVAHKVNVTSVRLAGSASDSNVKIIFWLWIILLGLFSQDSTLSLLSVIVSLYYGLFAWNDLLSGIINLCRLSPAFYLNTYFYFIFIWCDVGRRT